MELDLERIHPKHIRWQEGDTTEQIAKKEKEAYKCKSAYLCELLNNGEEQAAADLISSHFDNFSTFGIPTAKTVLDIFCDSFKNPEILFNLITDVYTGDGYNFPKHVIQKAKRLAKEIPPEQRLKGLPDGEILTVWRGCNVANPDCGQFLRTCVSWTTDKTMAIWFANRISNPNTKNGKGSVWEATIERNKIIAFLQDRNESEVLQHMSVKSPHLLDISDEEWAAALELQVKRKENYNKELDSIIAAELKEA